ncbi:6-phosphofructokinase [Reticulomyxa filosa]|uniref:6-phosphofructokinase n=1 Tax=Reticulomyxa filosa TaxID=46433 RepID=X6NLL8_RETFI|nr:6-phosphofructokinase [Reticulomyxa filosa]|eukprot:ETO26624.1 6-phosphofructokinase [Reticulomyxa filosa]
MSFTSERPNFFEALKEDDTKVTWGPEEDVCGIIVGGSSVPGINSCIASIVNTCVNNGITCLGIERGFRELKKCTRIEKTQLPSFIKKLTMENVGKRYMEGGSLLYTSDEQLRNEKETETALKVLETYQVSLLITIGGVETCQSANHLFSMSKTISVRHIPKTIFNDLPLPPNCTTFGYSTARQLGTEIMSNTSQDAKAMNRWYIITCLGWRSGSNIYI